MTKDTPYLPTNTQQIIDDGIAAYKAGASMLHIHARNDDGTPTHNPEKFIPLLDAYKQQCPDAIIQMSVGGMEGRTFELLEPLLKLRPDIASFNLKGTREETLYMVEKFNQYQVKPIIECFSLDMLKMTHAIMAEGLLKGPVFFEMLFELKDEGRSFEQLASELLEFYKWIPEGAIWSLTRGGSSHVRLQALSAALGGHIRTGIEDCISYREGEFVKSSAELITQAAIISEKMGRAIATPKQAREILGV
ncbi:MAG: 3-keto-5-aminohexanoate cleavage protein [Clostridiales bacterium]|jgi:3-keto-5-aminohexanoate cleavage enzyme|nr:3-keto-5-aminohexanoate cleavage protein [Clostridiales bacterium]